MAYFQVTADAYARFMGRFSTPLSLPFAELGLEGVPHGGRVLDVGCGPGILTAELVRRYGEASVSAVDPVETFVTAAAEAFPAADVRLGRAEQLPFDDATFDAALAQLVVHFMADPVAGLREMARVTRPGGRVSACVWDHGGETGPVSGFWRVAKAVDPDLQGEGRLAGSHRGDLTDLLTRVGLREVREVRLTVSVRFASFEEWWAPYTLGVGPAGAHVASLDDAGRERLVAALREEYDAAPFTIDATAWAATGVR